MDRPKFDLLLSHPKFWSSTKGGLLRDFVETICFLHLLVADSLRGGFKFENGMNFINSCDFRSDIFSVGTSAWMQFHYTECWIPAIITQVTNHRVGTDSRLFINKCESSTQFAVIQWKMYCNCDHVVVGVIQMTQYYDIWNIILFGSIAHRNVTEILFSCWRSECGSNEIHMT